jgi:glycosyltransferase involved in cell wall biosynthesis
VPTRVLDLELTDPAELPTVPLRYGRVRFLLRLHGLPLGYWEIQNDGRRTKESVVADVAGWYAPQVWSTLAAERFPVEQRAERQQPAIDVIVCTRNRPQGLDRALDALSRQRYPEYRVIVVDNGPHTETREVASRYATTYVIEARAGLDWARNRGLLEARAPIVAYTDDDARADPGWLEAIAAGFASGSDVEVVTGCIVPQELETHAQHLFEDVYRGMQLGFDFRLECRRGRSLTYHTHLLGAGVNMAFKREALDAIGGFDPALDAGTRTGGAGDLDAFQRIVERGGAIAYRPDAIVRHTHRRSVRELRRQMFDNGSGYGAAHWAAFRRARGSERLRVSAWAWRWYWWETRAVARALVRRKGMPFSYRVRELAGFTLGPLRYTSARRRARRLLAAGATP